MSLNKLFNYASLVVPVLKDILSSPQRLNRHIQANIELQRREYGEGNSFLSSKALATAIQTPIAMFQVSAGGIAGVWAEALLTGSVSGTGMGMGMGMAFGIPTLSAPTIPLYTAMHGMIKCATHPLDHLFDDNVSVIDTKALPETQRALSNI